MDDDGSAARPSIAELCKQYDEERFYQEYRAAAEYAYVLAVRIELCNMRPPSQSSIDPLASNSYTANST
jgi:hypothetical protein